MAHKYKLTNVTVESYDDLEWEIRFYFGGIYNSLWLYKDIEVKAILQQILGLMENFIYNGVESK